MNVPELCAALVERLQLEVTAVEGGGGTIPPDVFSDALTPEWLAENVDEIFAVINNQEGTEDALVGNLEINAFLATFL